MAGHGQWLLLALQSLELCCLHVWLCIRYHLMSHLDQLHNTAVVVASSATLLCNDPDKVLCLGHGMQACCLARKIKVILQPPVMSSEMWYTFKDNQCAADPGPLCMK